MMKALTYILLITCTVSSKQHHRRGSLNKKLRSKNDSKQMDTFDSNIESITCNVSKVFIQYSPTDEDVEYVCERQDSIVHASSFRYRSFDTDSNPKISIKKIVGIDENFIKKYDELISSPSDTIINFNSVKETNDEIIINGDITIPNNRKLQNRMLKNKSEGSYRLVYVRITGLDETMSSTFSSSAELSRRIFGGHDDLVNLSNQMKTCSYDKLTIVPGEGSGITNGVLDIKVPRVVSGMEANELMNLSYEIAWEEYRLNLGDRNKYNFVFFCVPDSARHNNRGFVAYSWMNGYRSIYSEKWCDSVSAQMHETGHLLGLSHSGVRDSNEEYGDVSCYMGYASQSSEIPKMCYNSIHSYQLGWYDDRTIRINPYKNIWEGNIIGFVDYGRATERYRRYKDQYYVTVEITDDIEEASTTTLSKEKSMNYYLSFNRIKSFNSNNRAFYDEILVIQGDERSYAQSWVLATLNQDNNVYKIDNIIIQLKSTTISKQENNIDFATIQVGVEQCYVNNTFTFCDDDNACTSDTCTINGCQNENIMCNDNDPCTIDTCDPIQGCVYTPISDNCIPCSTSSDCDHLSTSSYCESKVYSCNEGICQESKDDLTYYCNDDDPNTIDTCNEQENKCYHVVQLSTSSLVLNEHDSMVITIQSFNTLDFAWSITSNLTFTRSIDELNLGTIDESGHYTAPILPLDDSIYVTIHAQNKNDDSIYGNITLEIIPCGYYNTTITITKEDDKVVTANDEIIFQADVTNNICNITNELTWSASIGTITSISPTQATYKPPPYLKSLHSNHVTIQVQTNIPNQYHDFLENELLKQREIRDRYVFKVIPACYQISDRNLFVDVDKYDITLGDTITMKAYCGDGANITWSSTIPFAVMQIVDSYTATFTIPNVTKALLWNDGLSRKRIRIMATTDDNYVVRVGKVFVFLNS